MPIARFHTSDFPQGTIGNARITVDFEVENDRRQVVAMLLEVRERPLLPLVFSSHHHRPLAQTFPGSNPEEHKRNEKHFEAVVGGGPGFEGIQVGFVVPRSLDSRARVVRVVLPSSLKNNPPDRR